MPMKRACPHNRLSNAKVIESVGTVWACKACGSLIPEAVLNIDMKFSPEWLLRVAKEEEDVRFSVGGWISEIEDCL